MLVAGIISVNGDVRSGEEGGERTGLVQVEHAEYVATQKNNMFETVVQPVMVAGVTTVRAAVSIEEELSITEAVQVALVITIPLLKLNMSGTVALTIGQMIIAALVAIYRENTSIEAVVALLATPGLSGELSKIVAQPVMALGIIIVRVMMSGEKELFTIEVVQEAAAIITLQPRTNLFRTVPQLPGPIIAPAMISGGREQ